MFSCSFTRLCVSLAWLPIRDLLLFLLSLLYALPVIAREDLSSSSRWPCRHAFQPSPLPCWPHVLQENVRSPDSTAKLRSNGARGEGAASRGLLATLSGNQRIRVSQDENSRAGLALPGGHGRVRLGGWHVDKYSRFPEGPSDS